MLLTLTGIFPAIRCILRQSFISIQAPRGKQDSKGDSRAVTVLHLDLGCQDGIGQLIGSKGQAGVEGVDFLPNRLSFFR